MTLPKPVRAGAGPLLVFGILFFGLGCAKSWSQPRQHVGTEPMCAQQARKQFPDYYRNTPGLDGFFSAKEHYNPRLRKCFVLLRRTSLCCRRDEVDRYEQLKDVFSGTIYGVYSNTMTTGRRKHRTRQARCEMTPVDGRRELCAGDLYWRAYVAGYLGEYP